MDVGLTEDQQLLVDTAARLAASIAGPSPASLPWAGPDDSSYAPLVETGFVGMHVGESSGGGGAHSSDVALVVEQLAGVLSLAPYLGQGVLAAEVLSHCDDPRAAEVLAGVLDGRDNVTVAFDASLGAMATSPDDAVAWDAYGARGALLIDESGHVLLVSLDGAEVINSVDLTRRVCRVAATAPVQVLGSITSVGSRQRLDAFVLAMLAADLVGVMQSAVDAAVDYVGSRRQFGVAVGTFQAVQHLAAEAKVLTEGARSAMWHGAWAVDELDPDEALCAARQAKAYCSRVGREVVELQVQLFGGIAITWEERAHVRVRRALFDRVLGGDEFTQEDAIATHRLGPIGASPSRVGTSGVDTSADGMNA